MNRVFVQGLGCVSHAGWGVPALREWLKRNEPVPSSALERPGWASPLRVRAVPDPGPRPAFLAHPRLRRSSVISHYLVGAGLEALELDMEEVRTGRLRLGIIACVMSGCVTYSRRFFEEIMADASFASPMLFPETVFNAPASHLAAVLGCTATNYTLVGDDSGFIMGLALAVGWLLNQQVDRCLVVGAEEMDWLVADAAKLFDPHSIKGAGAGALYLGTGPTAHSKVELACITDAFPFSFRRQRKIAAQQVRSQLPSHSQHELLCLGTQGRPVSDRDELEAWSDWQGARCAPKELLGEAFTASAAWQCVAACDALNTGGFQAANVSVIGANEMAIGCRFVQWNPASTRRS